MFVHEPHSCMCPESRGSGMGLACLRTRGRDYCWPVRYFVVCAAQTLTRLPHRATERPQGQPRERGCIAREGFWCGALLRCACFSFAASSCDVDMTCPQPDAHTCRRRGVECGVLRHGCWLDHCRLWLGFIVLSSTGPPDVWCEVCLPSRRVV